MKGMKVSAAGFADALGDVIQQYSDEVCKALPDIVKDVANKAKKELQGSAPSKSGAYKKSFATKKTDSSSSLTTIEIYSKKPGLPHLLEFGHVVKNQYGVYGVTAARPHWAPAEEAANEELEKQIKEKIEEAG